MKRSGQLGNEKATGTILMFSEILAGALALWIQRGERSTIRAQPLDYEPTKMYLGALTEEYRTIRDESKQANINMMLVMQIGAAACAVVIGAAAARWEDVNGATPLLLLVVVPILSAVSLLIWIGEARRFRRAGDYLCLVERKVWLAIKALALPRALEQEWPSQQMLFEVALGFIPTEPLCGPLSWEQWLRTARSRTRFEWSVTSGHDLLLYIVRAAFFPAIMAVSMVLGLLQLWTTGTDAFGEAWGWLVGISFAILLVSVGLAISIAWKIQKPADPTTWPQMAIPSSAESPAQPMGARKG